MEMIGEDDDSVDIEGVTLLDRMEGLAKQLNGFWIFEDGLAVVGDYREEVCGSGDVDASILHGIACRFLG